MKAIAYTNHRKQLINPTITTKYYIDFVCEFDNDGNFVNTYYQIARTKDDAILYANIDIRQIYAECFSLGINNNDITII